MSRAEAVKLGPFTGGMNAASDPSILDDTEVVDCVNFELDLDGSLAQRPPFFEYDNSSAQTHFTAIGTYINAGVRYIIFCATSAGVYAYRPDTSAFTTISTTMQSKIALQYRDKVYIVATEGSPVAGGYWDPSGGFVSQATMPRGEGAVFNKARMFVVPGRNATVNKARLTFCDSIVADVFVWTATNIIDVNPGDGQNLVDVIVYNDNLMLFKEDSTYVLAYDLQITDAVLRSVNLTIGASNTYCIAAYENSVFVYHEGKIYEMSNYDFTQINTKVPFVLDQTVPGGSSRLDVIFLNILGDRLLVRYYNRMYVYGLKTKTWSRWESSNSIMHNVGPLVPYPSIALQGVNQAYYGGSSLNNSHSIISFVDALSAQQESHLVGVVDTVISYLVTKNYDMSDSYHFKKLSWWGADVYTNQAVTAFANPVINTFKVRWADLTPYRWYAISTNRWYAPLSVPITLETDVTNVGNALRKFLKFRKALRFRQLNFKIVLTGDSSTGTGPPRFFSMTAFVSQKELVSKQVS